ncbi:hypothetical protein CPB83DRAFT_917241, partial [Crepidotus variabilis]
DWDYWPDGNFECDFTVEEVKVTSGLMTHYATIVGGGDKTGKSNADCWQNGKRATRKCLGVIFCANQPSCQAFTRPNTKPKTLEKQLQGSCGTCGSELIHEPCDVRSILWKWERGIHFRPLGLLVGPRGVTGPGKSVADISDVLLNKDRIAKERQKITRGADGGGDAFVATFAEFTTTYPDFLIFHIFGPVTVLSLQTPFMRSKLVSKNTLDEPINGLVNDAAHGFWKERNSLLMITSVYCPELFCWVPGLMSFTNGASTNHFKYHFMVLFERMAFEAEEQDIPVTDELFAGVMDFSEAERGGFIEGFVSFWLERSDNTRNERELLEAAALLLRGCREHFRAGVTRISRAGAIIPVPRQEEFVRRAVGLLIFLQQYPGWSGGFEKNMHLCCLIHGER